ncbi:MAG: hypothetical protein RMA76_44525 [Deltaproteobacteria bacterium]|jgi:hypothetical protein
MSYDRRRYEKLIAGGADAAAVYRVARADGLATGPCMRLLRELFDLGVGDAKEVMLVADGVAASRDAHEGRIADALEKAFD